ncbi:MAG: tetratricopeptide repeat protein [Bacteroidales bacterium]|jgi:tetratricopeptide (TPR) repeat protein|nr:tetratricopeptide repeat protein [Bacteroidales bacterium]
MKKLSILTLFALLCAHLGFAQSDEFVMTWSIVVNEVKKADASIENPKKAANPKTWMELGRKYLLLYSFDLKDIQPGISASDAMFMVGSPKTQTADSGYNIFNYDRLDLFFKNDKLVRYERTGDAKQYFPEHSTALDVATNAYMKAKELDVAGKQSKTISDQLKTITDNYTTEGYYFYVAQDYVNASKYFSKVGDIVTKGIINQTNDERAIMLNDCGTVAKLAKDYPKAIEFYNKAIELAPKISLYGEVYACQKASGDTTSAINTLLTAIDAFPNDSLAVSYTTELINLYIQTNQSDQALTYLTKALEKDPNNVSFLYNKGVLYTEKKQIEEAKIAYLQALAIDPKDEGSNLNLGLLFTAAANEKAQEADKVWKDKKAYAALLAERDALLKQAYPYLEVYASVVNDIYQKRDAYKDLRNIYAQLGMVDAEKAAKEKMDALLN